MLSTDTITGVVAGAILGFLIGLFFHLRSRRVSVLECSFAPLTKIDLQPSVIEGRAKEKLQATFAGRRLNALSVLRATLKNSGTETLTKDQIEKPVSFSFAEDVNVLDVDLVDCSSSVRAIPGSDAPVLDWRFASLNRGEYFTLQFILEGHVQALPAVSGRIIGSKIRIQTTELPGAENHLGKSVALQSAVLLLLMVVSAAYAFWQSSSQFEQERKLYAANTELQASLHLQQLERKRLLAVFDILRVRRLFLVHVFHLGLGMALRPLRSHRSASARGWPSERQPQHRRPPPLLHGSSRRGTGRPGMVGNGAGDRGERLAGRLTVGRSPVLQGALPNRPRIGRIQAASQVGSCGDSQPRRLADDKPLLLKSRRRVVPGSRFRCWQHISKVTAPVFPPVTQATASR